MQLVHSGCLNMLNYISNSWLKSSFLESLALLDSFCIQQKNSWVGPGTESETYTCCSIFPYIVDTESHDMCTALHCTVHCADSSTWTKCICHHRSHVFFRSNKDQSRSKVLFTAIKRHLTNDLPKKILTIMYFLFNI